MYKKILPLLFFGIFMTLIAKNAFAGFLTLTRIGTLSTAGQIYTTWSVTGVSPDFSGTATPGAMVALTVNAITSTTSAAISGVWILKPTNIVTGVNSVSIASGNETMSFLLNYTPAASPTAAIIPEATSGALPEAGTPLLPIMVIGLGLIVFIFGKVYKSRVEEEWNI